MGKFGFFKRLIKNVSIVLSLLILIVLTASQSNARGRSGKTIPMPKANKEVVQVTASDEAGSAHSVSGTSNIEPVEEELWPIAPQTYDGFEGKVQEPFAPSEVEKKKIRKQVAKRKAAEKKKALLAKKRAAAKARRIARAKKAVKAKRTAKRTAKRVSKRSAKRTAKRATKRSVARKRAKKRPAVAAKSKKTRQPASQKPRKK